MNRCVLASFCTHPQSTHHLAIFVDLMRIFKNDYFSIESSRMNWPIWLIWFIFLSFSVLIRACNLSSLVHFLVYLRDWSRREGTKEIFWSPFIQGSNHITYELHIYSGGNTYIKKILQVNNWNIERFALRLLIQPKIMGITYVFSFVYMVVCLLNRMKIHSSFMSPTSRLYHFIRKHIKYRDEKQEYNPNMSYHE